GRGWFPGRSGRWGGSARTPPFCRAACRIGTPMTDRLPETAGPSAPEEAPVRPSDRPLVERSLTGDLKAFEELVARYQKAVFHIAHYKCRNYFDAEDLSQDIFLAAYRALPSLKDPDNFGG